MTTISQNNLMAAWLAMCADLSNETPSKGVFFRLMNYIPTITAFPVPSLCLGLPNPLLYEQTMAVLDIITESMRSRLGNDSVSFTVVIEGPLHPDEVREKVTEFFYNNPRIRISQVLEVLNSEKEEGYRGATELEIEVARFLRNSGWKLQQPVDVPTVVYKDF